MTPPELDPADGPTDLERRIAAWRPAPPDVDRDRLMFEAGRASARTELGVSAWKFGFASMTLLSLILGFRISRENPRATGIERAIVSPAVSVAPPAVSAPGPAETVPDSYLTLTRLALADRNSSRPRPPVGPNRSTPAPTPLLARDPDRFSEF